MKGKGHRAQNVGQSGEACGRSVRLVKPERKASQRHNVESSEGRLGRGRSCKGRKGVPVEAWVRCAGRGVQNNLFGINCRRGKTAKPVGLRNPGRDSDTDREREDFHKTLQEESGGRGRDQQRGLGVALRGIHQKGKKWRRRPNVIKERLSSNKKPLILRKGSAPARL